MKPKPITEDQLRAELAKSARDVGSQKELAARLRISPQYLGDVLHGRRDISAALAANLGYTRVVLFQPDE